MSRITREQVEYVAGLARLDLSEPEAERMTAELATVLDYVETLSELDTRGVEPTSHVIPLPTPLREDRPAPPLDPELAVANAPDRVETAFAVPVVIGSEDEG